MRNVKEWIVLLFLPYSFNFQLHVCLICQQDVFVCIMSTKISSKRYICVSMMPDIVWWKPYIFPVRCDFDKFVNIQIIIQYCMQDLKFDKSKERMYQYMQGPSNVTKTLRVGSIGELETQSIYIHNNKNRGYLKRYNDYST